MLHSQYCSPNINRDFNFETTEMFRTRSMNEVIQKYVQSLVGRSQGRKRLRRSRRRWEDNINIDLRVVGCDAGDWIDLD